MRLVSEVGQEKKSAGQSQEAINSLTRERDSLQQKIREMEIEVDRLKHQIAASQDAWGVAKKQLDEKQNKYVHTFMQFDFILKCYQLTVNNSQNCEVALTECLHFKVILSAE